MSTFDLEEVERPDSDDEISKERKKFLAERLKIEADDVHSIFPFKDIKLKRADIEWLLSIHDNNRGPVNWNDVSQRERRGLDLRGADLRDLDLSRLPLTKCQLSDAHLENASLFQAHLEGAYLSAAFF